MSHCNLPGTDKLVSLQGTLVIDGNESQPTFCSIDDDAVHVTLLLTAMMM